MAGTEGGHWTDLLKISMDGRSDKHRYRYPCKTGDKSRYFKYSLYPLHEGSTEFGDVYTGVMAENRQDDFKDEFGAQPWKADIDKLSNDQLGDFFNIHISHHNENNNKVKFYGIKDDPEKSGKCVYERSITVAKSGQADLEALAEQAATGTGTQAQRAEQLKTPHSTLYIASVSKGVQRDDTGLVKADSFKLNWNNLETKAEWKTGVRTKFSEIQDGEVPGTIALMKEEIYIPELGEPSIEGLLGEVIGKKKYNQYYDLNTGKNQNSPTLRGALSEIDTDEHKFGSNVTYGKVERKALKDKYKRFEGDYSTGMDLAIDRVVRQAAKDSKVKSRYNFKRVDTNERFKKKELSFFAGEGQVKETVEISTTAQGGGLSEESSAPTGDSLSSLGMARRGTPGGVY